TYQADGGSQIIERADRSKITINPDQSTAVESGDGSKIIRDAAQNVTDVTYAPRPGETAPESRHFDYDKHGNLVGVRDKDGTYWRPGPDKGEWTQYPDQKSDRPTGKTWYGTATVDKDTGEYTYAKTGEKLAVVEKADGTRASLNLDPNGKP